MNEDPESKYVELMAAEYTMLRTELISLFSQQVQLITFVFAGLGGCAAFAYQYPKSSIIVALFPMFALALAYGYRSMDDRIIQIATYIKKLEDSFPILRWATFLSKCSRASKHTARQYRSPKWKRFWEWRLPGSRRLPVFAFAGSSLVASLLYSDIVLSQSRPPRAAELVAGLTAFVFTYITTRTVMYVQAMYPPKEDVFHTTPASLRSLQSGESKTQAPTRRTRKVTSTPKSPSTKPKASSGT